jgi:hypothetical protein
MRRIIGDYDNELHEGIMFIMQGTPGQGKSTTASKIQLWCKNEGIECEIFSTDNHFTSATGHYKFHGPSVSMAHQVTQFQVEEYLRQEHSTGKICIVDNCNLFEWEQVSYKKFAYRHGYMPVIIDLRNKPVRKNVHGVSTDRVMSNLDKSLDESNYGIKVTDLDPTYVKILKKLRKHTEHIQAKATLTTFGDVIEFLVDNTEMVMDNE